MPKYRAATSVNSALLRRRTKQGQARTQAVLRAARFSQRKHTHGDVKALETQVAPRMRDEAGILAVTNLLLQALGKRLRQTSIASSVPVSGLGLGAMLGACGLGIFSCFHAPFLPPLAKEKTGAGAERKDEGEGTEKEKF